jgi:hypothetical protein
LFWFVVTTFVLTCPNRLKDAIAMIESAAITIAYSGSAFPASPARSVSNREVSNIFVRFLAYLECPLVFAGAPSLMRRAMKRSPITV